MQMLYIFKSFPGSMQPLLRFISADKAHTAVFMAERWQRDTALPGVKRVHIPAPTPLDAPAPEKFSGQRATESTLMHYVRRAEAAGGIYDRLRTMGFRPDLIYAAPDSGHALYVKDYFPSARLIFRAEYYHRRENARASSPPEAPSAPLAEADAALVQGEQASSPPLSPLQRVHNASMITALEEGDAAITSSAWQKSLFPRWLGEKIHIARSGVHTQLFRPPLSESPEKSQEESIVFSFHGSTLARSMASIGQSLPELLAARPACRVRILFFARTRSERERKEHTANIAALLPPPPPTQRIEIIVSPTQSRYITLLQNARVYVYQADPTMLSAGILEAMSCGALVLASDTGPVRDVVQHGENGFLADLHDPTSLARAVTDVLQKAPALMPVRHRARTTILEHYDIQKNLAHHAALLLGR